MRTQLVGLQLANNTVQRLDMDITTPGQCVVTKVLPGTGISMASTGVDEGY